MTIIENILQSPVFGWVILPLLIFVSRICDVSIGTIRIIFVSRGKRFLAPLLGFFEVSVWLLAISQIMQRLDNPVCFLAYAAGFSMGNYVGIRLEEKLAVGNLIVRIFLTDSGFLLKEQLYEAGFGVTSIAGHGRNGELEILFSVIKSKYLGKIIEVIEDCQTGAFYSVEDAKSVNRGYFKDDRQGRHLPGFNKSKSIRKGK